MSRAQGSVRIGPISLFTLVVVLCLAVMAVLAVTTAQATYASAEKQALFTADTYKNETAAQMFVADVDAALASVRDHNGASDETPAAGTTSNAALTAVDRVLPAGAERDGSVVSATFTTDSGRTLAVELTIHADATYEITSWKATTQWTDSDSGETLWSGPAETR